jgi:hypothetical protein
MSEDKNESMGEGEGEGRCEDESMGGNEDKGPKPYKNPGRVVQVPQYVEKMGVRARRDH